MTQPNRNSIIIFFEFIRINVSAEYFSTCFCIFPAILRILQIFKDSNIQRFENFTFLSLIRKRLGLIKFNPNKNRMISVGIFVLNMCSNIDCLYKWSESEKYTIQTRRDG